MRFKCKIVIGLDIQDCIGVYPYDDSLLNIIINKYEGYCFKGKYIEKVERIITKGECIINQQGSPNFGTASIICEMTVIQYNPGEIITGVVINNVGKSGVITGQTDIACIYVPVQPTIGSLKEKQIIPIVVGQAKYIPGSQKISISGRFYFPEMTPITKNIDTTNIDIDIPLLADVLSRISYEEAKAEQLKSANKVAWDFFDKLLYSYKDKPQINLKTITLQELLNQVVPSKQSITVTRDPRVGFSQPLVVIEDANTITTDDSIPIVNSSNPTQNMLEILENYYNRMRVIREMIDTYSTSELINSHKNVWQIIGKNKK